MYLTNREVKELVYGRNLGQKSSKVSLNIPLVLFAIQQDSRTDF